MRTAITSTIVSLLIATIPFCRVRAEELVILSPHWEGIKWEIGEAFTEYWRRQRRGEIELRWLDTGGGTSDIIKFIRSEFALKPQGIGVDLLFGGGMDPFVELKRQGLLSRVEIPPDHLNQLAPDINGIPLYDPEHYWYSAGMAAFGILFNRAILSRLGLPEPRTWEDLAAPHAYSWVGSADPRKSGSAHVAYEVILQAYGWERGWKIIYGLGGNARTFTSAASQTPKDIAVGEIAYGFVIDSYAAEAIRRVGAEKMGFVVPADLSAVSGDGIAVLRGAPNRSAAETFLRFVLSSEGQKIIFLNRGTTEGPKRYHIGKLSVMPSLYEHPDRSTNIHPFSWRSNFTYNPTLASRRWTLVNDLIGTFIVDVHSQLTELQRQRIKERRTIGDELNPPLTEEETEALLAGGGYEKGVRTRKVIEWERIAQARFPPGHRWISFLPAAALGTAFFFASISRGRAFVRRKRLPRRAETKA